MTLNFPGNPYDAKRRQEMTETDRIVNAIELLAFEVRTANIIAAAQPVVTESKEASDDARERLSEAALRLGLVGARTTTS